MSDLPAPPRTPGQDRPFRLLYSGSPEVKRPIVEKLARSNAIFSVHGFLVDDSTGFQSNGMTSSHLQFRASEGHPGQQKPETRVFEKPDLAVVFHARGEEEATWHESALLSELGIPVLDIDDDASGMPPPNSNTSIVESQDSTKHDSVAVRLAKFLRTDDDKLCRAVGQIIKPCVDEARDVWWSSCNQQATYTHPWRREEREESPAAALPAYESHGVQIGESKNTAGFEEAKKTNNETLPPYEQPHSTIHDRYEFDLERGFSGEESQHYWSRPVLLRIVGVEPEADRGKIKLMIRPWTLWFFIFYAVLVFAYSCYILAVHLPALLSG